MDAPFSGGKVAIPRLERPFYDRPSKPRVPIACLKCRKRKVRCSGEQPSCQNCVQQQAECLYPEGRKDRLKSAEEQSQSLVELLRDLSMHVDESWQQRIDEALEAIRDDATTPTHASEASKTIGPSLEPLEEAPKMAPIDEDFFENPMSMGVGFIGQSSEIQWLRHLQAATVDEQPLDPVLPSLSSRSNAEIRTPKPSGAKSSRTNPKPPVADFTFYLNGEDHDLDVVVSPDEIPSLERAHQLMDLYRTTIHSSFPILPDDFEEQFWKDVQPHIIGEPHRTHGRWKGVMNVVFAIGAQYLQLANIEWNTGPLEHVIYARRAMLALDLDSLVPALSSPSLTLVQATALLSFYHLTVGYVSRAWMMIGVSVRFAVALGLHLRKDNASTPQARKLTRIWWCIYSLESLISSLIGRECLISRNQCTATMPDTSPCGLEWCSLDAPARGKASSEVCPSYFGASVAIDVIEHKVMSRLYPSRTPLQPAKSIRKITASLLHDLENWASAVQLQYIGQTDWTPSGSTREQSLLIFKYLRVKILICRPCLSETQWQKEEDDFFPSFALETRRLCVEAARTLADQLPNSPDIALIHRQCPYWCIVHHIMQALAVLLFELSKQEMIPDDTVPNVRCAKKLCRVLRAMSVRGFVARRAYGVVNNLLQKGAPQLRRFAVEIMSDEGVVQADPFVPGPLADHRSVQVPIRPQPPILASAATTDFGLPSYGIGGQDPLQTLDEYPQPLFPGSVLPQWPTNYSYLGEDAHMDGGQ